MKHIRKLSNLILAALPLLGLPLTSSASVGLIVYDAIMIDPWLTKAGHAGVLLTNVCMTDELNKFRVCNDEDKANGVKGVVIQRYSDMAPGTTHNDWIALPLNMNLYGTNDRGDSPILGSQQVLKVLQTNAYNNDELHLNEFMTPVVGKKETVAPAIPDGNWQYSIGMTEIRSGHIFFLPTSAEEDQRAVDFLNNNENISHFSQYFRNCANFANDMIRAMKPSYNGRARFEDAFLVTPSSDAKAVKKLAQHEDVPYLVTVNTQIPGTPRRSATPTEMVMQSNSNLAVSIPLRFTPTPGGLIFTGFKYIRSKFGLHFPGIRPPMNIEDETHKNGTDELSETNYELGHAKKDHDSDKVSELKQKLGTLQNETWGTPACWSAQEKKLSLIVDKAIDAEVIDSSYSKPFQIHDKLNRMLRMIPMVQLNPTQGKLVNKVINSPGTEIENSSDGLVMERGGVTAGLTRNNISKHDQKLGFLILASSIDFNLGQPISRRPAVGDFDADWDLMIKVGRNAGIDLGTDDESGIASCVAQSEQTEQASTN
jgi:hypothetical protein